MIDVGDSRFISMHTATSKETSSSLRNPLSDVCRHFLVYLLMSMWTIYTGLGEARLAVLIDTPFSHAVQSAHIALTIVEGRLTYRELL